MKKTLFLTTLLLSSVAAMAQNTVIDISGNNTSSNYKSYNTAFSIAAGKTVDVRMARYCYFSSKITGKGTLRLYAGGERCYLGTKKGETWPDWTGFTGDVHIYQFKENASAGFYGVVLAHGGKSSTPDNALDDAKSGKVNPSMANNRVTLHSGATLCCEGTSGTGFRIGELQTEVGSTIMGYMKYTSSDCPAYFLVGGLNTDATLAGDIIPAADSKTGTIKNSLGIVKEGTGTYRITGNNNYLTGALRVLQGRVLINNNRAEAETKKLRGGLGAKSNENEAVAYVFTKGVLGGTGSIGGAVDNYGTIEPGDDTPGSLTLKNYASPAKNANLTIHPASVLRFKVASADSHDRLDIAGILKYNNATEYFSTSDAQPVVELMLLDDFVAEVGTELPLVTAKSKSGNWEFRLKQPGKGTWMLEEKTDADGYKLVAKLVSTSDADNPDDPDNPDEPESTMGAFYDDGIDDKADTHTLRYYAEKNEKFVGGALCTYKSYDYERAEAAKQYNMLVAENEMKMEVLQPSQGQFSYGSSDALVSLAQNNKMAVRGHCLVWNQQQPEWLSGDKGKKNDKHWTRQQALDIMKDHITNVMQHFKGKVTEWDVVNECLDDDQSIIRSNPDGYKIKSSVWQLAIGDDYVDSAFVYAHRADPTAKLYLNDYDVELHGKAKTVAYYNLARHLQSQNIPIDGVGLQCHFSIGDVDSVKLEKTIQRFGEIGLKCIITELDMGIPSTSSANLEEQARNYRVITDIMLNNDNCPSMLIWGIKDNDSWREGKNPLLYDAGMGKKRAWYAVRSALRHRYLLLSNGIESLAPASSQNESAVYDLSGRRIQGRPSRPGIYIIGGKKVIIR